MSNDKIRIVLTFSLFLLIVLLMAFKAKKEQKRLIGSHVEVDGVITFINNKSSISTAATEYEYFDKGIRYVGSFPTGAICEELNGQEREGLLGRRIRVIYDPSNPDINRALISQSQIDLYRIKLEDSMKEFIEYAFECD